METRNAQMSQTISHAIWFCISAWIATWCHVAGGETPNAIDLIERMKRNLSLPQNASMEVVVKSTSTWHDAPGAEVAPYSGDSVEHWQLKSDQERFGKEFTRESPGGASRSRTVIAKDNWRVFDFDTAAAPDANVLGQMQIRDQYFYDSPWQVPLADYLDRVFMFSTRIYESGVPLDCAPDMVMIDGHPCYEVRGTWNGRVFVFWLDPEYGYLPRQYTMTLDYNRQEFRGRRGTSGQSFLQILAPPAMQGMMRTPEESEERLSGVVLKRIDGRSYIAQATLEKTRSFGGAATYKQRFSFETTAFKLSTAPDVAAFLDFEGLLRDGTPVSERIGGGAFSQDSTRDLVWMNGRLAKPKMSFGAYTRQTWKDLRNLATDFSIENLKRLDSKLLIAVCAVAALLVNGGMAYASYRRKKSKTP